MSVTYCTTHHTHTHTHTHTHAHTHTHRERHTDRRTLTHTHTDRCTLTHRQTERDRCTLTHTHRERDERETDALTHTTQRDATLMLIILVYRFIYETERHNGVAELLEILGRYSVLILAVHLPPSLPPSVSSTGLLSR